jgi:DNA-binding SARP family transcriptional activator
MNPLEIRLFGSMQILRGDLPLPYFESNKVRALLAYLVVEASQSQPRRKLANLLWPEVSETKALSNLRYALSNLRKVLGDRTAQIPFLIITSQSIQFDILSDYRLDVAEFEKYSKHALQNPLDFISLKKAAELYQGPFLESFSIPDSVPFEEWLVLKRERFAHLAYQVFHKLANDYERIGEYDQAISYARRQIAFDPWREEVHRQLMRCLYFSGQRSAAIVQYENCCKMLLDDLGIDPSTDTRKLFEEIHNNSLEPPPSPPEFFLRSSSLPIFESNFVGRSDSMARLHRALNQAIGSQGQLVLITGSPGQGKTALVKEFIQQALEENPQLAAAWGNAHAYFGSGDPFLPFREILEMLTGQVENQWDVGAISHDHARRMWRLTEPCAQVLVHKGSDLIGTFVSRAALLERVAYALQEEPVWLSQLMENEGEVTEKRPVTREDLIQQYVRVLIEISYAVPLLIFVDDLQWADQASIDMFYHLSLQISPARILVIGAFRPIDWNKREEGGTQSLNNMVNELQIIQGDIIIDLDQMADRTFIDAYLDQDPNKLGEDFRDKLYSYTHSHPLFTIELLFEMKRRGDLIKNGAGEWITSAHLDWDHLPPQIEAVIKERLSHLPSEFLDLLIIASVEGEGFTIEVLADVQQIDEEEVLFKIREELDHHFRLVLPASSKRVAGNRRKRYRFRHILFQKYLYTHLDVIERTELHERVGIAIENRYHDSIEEMSVPLAIHFELAGLPIKAIQYYDLAGKQAILLKSYEDAVTHLKKALKILKAQPKFNEKNQLEMKLLMSLSVPLMFIGGFASSELSVVSDRIVELLDRISLRVEMFPIMHTLTQYYGLRADYKKMLWVLQLANQLANTSGDELYLRLSDWGYGFLFLLLGKLEDSLLKLENMVNYYDYLNHRELLHTYGNDPGVASRVWSSWTLWLLGYPNKAMARCQDAIDLSNRLDDPANQLLSQLLSAFVYLLMKNPQFVEKRLQFASSLLSQQPSALYAEDLEFLTSFLLFQKNRSESSLKRMYDSVLSYQEIGNQSMLSLYFTLLAEGYLDIGQLSQTGTLLEKAENFIEKTGERFYQAEVLRVKGRYMENGGNEKEAEKYYLDALHVADKHKAKALALRAATSLAKMWLIQGRAQEAYKVLSEVYNTFTEGFDTADLMTARALLQELGQ